MSKFDLDERTFNFAKGVRSFVKTLPRTISNIEDIKQVTRSSGSVGANYIEASEPISPKDFKFRIKLCRKEAKESQYFLRLIDTNDKRDLNTERNRLTKEALELTKIFGAIINKF